GSFKVGVAIGSTQKNTANPKVEWYRHYFTIDTSLVNLPLNLTIKHLGASEIYLDGNLLAKTGTINPKGKSYYRNLKSDINIFAFKDTGLHVFAVRYEKIKSGETDKTADFGFYLAIEKANESIKNRIEQTEQITFYCMLIFGVFIALAFVHFLLFIFYRTAIYNLYFGLFNLSLALISLAIYLKWSSENPVIESKALEAIFYIMCIWCFSITAFVNTLFGLHKKRFKVMGI